MVSFYLKPLRNQVGAFLQSDIVWLSGGAGFGLAVLLYVILELFISPILTLEKEVAVPPAMVVEGKKSLSQAGKQVDMAAAGEEGTGAPVASAKAEQSLGMPSKPEGEEEDATILGELYSFRASGKDRKVLEAELSEQQNVVRSLRVYNQTLRERNASLHDQINGLKYQLKQQTTRNNELVNALAAVKRKREQLATLRLADNALIARRQPVLKKVQSEIITLEQALRQSENQVIGLKGQLATVIDEAGPVSAAAEVLASQTRPAPAKWKPNPGQTAIEPLTRIALAWVPGGNFLMGSSSSRYKNEQPVHPVRVASYWMGRHEVTQAQWQRVMGNNPSRFQSRKNKPVENVSWHEAQAFITKLYRLTGLQFQLPTEAQWEYAARSGGGQKIWAGTADESELADYAWFLRDETAEVGNLRANGFGLYDLSGNVWEWCADSWAENYRHAPSDGTAQRGRNPFRVIRGGAWDDFHDNLKVTRRVKFLSSNRADYLGFRVVLTEKTVRKNKKP